MINLKEPCIDKQVGYSLQLASNLIYYIYTTPKHVLYKSMFSIELTSLVLEATELLNYYNFIIFTIYIILFKEDVLKSTKLYTD